MSLKRQRLIVKLMGLAEDDTRQKLIDGIMRRKQNTAKLYAWKIDSAYNLAEKAFFSQAAAVQDWYAKERVWESKEAGGVVVHSWSVCVDDLIKYISEGCVCNIPLSEDSKIEVATPPSGLHGDIQQTLKQQA